MGQEYLLSLRSFFSSRWVTLVLWLGIIGATVYIGVAISQHNTTQLQNSAVVDAEAKFSSNNKIVRYLPYSSTDYSVSYSTYGNDPVTITISARYPYDRNQALMYLISKDPNVTINHKILFLDFESPLIKKTGDDHGSTDIQTSLRGAYTNLANLYTTTVETYGDTWASATLEYAGKSQTQRDTLYAILHKDSVGVWRLSVEPKIAISKADSPEDIPAALLQAIIPTQIDVESLQSAWNPSY